MIFLLDSYDIPMGLLWDSDRNSMIFLLDFYDISMGLLWVSLVFLWDFFRGPIGFP